MRVLIVGAGQQGQVITWNLGRNPAVTEIVVSDYDEARARLIAEQVGNGKAKAAFIHSTPASIYAEFIVEGKVAAPGLVCPEELPRAVRDASSRSAAGADSR